MKCYKYLCPIYFYYHKASLWAENCPNFSFFLFGPGNLNYDKIFERGTTRQSRVILIMGLPLLKFSLGNIKLEDPFGLIYHKAFLWAENCPNFLAGTSPDFGAGKTEVFSGKNKFLALKLRSGLN
jgi:hypothetical protein